MAAHLSNMMPRNGKSLRQKDLRSCPPQKWAHLSVRSSKRRGFSGQRQDMEKKTRLYPGRGSGSCRKARYGYGMMAVRQASQGKSASGRKEGTKQVKKLLAGTLTAAKIP